MADVLRYDKDCIFCKIIKGEIPSTKVYEDENCYAFRDINPQAPVHILVVPKTHIASCADIDAENAHIAGEIFTAIAFIARQEGLDGGYRVITNCGEDAGQTVHHLHFHILAGVKMGERLL
ncbi:MAG: histidine triad nucleotide-binding protein [Oscillospiraceae bacterium]|nr:histidine triad nucleotide-binding protein [Oscillospiraceae bacterium]